MQTYILICMCNWLHNDACSYLRLCDRTAPVCCEQLQVTLNLDWTLMIIVL